MAVATVTSLYGQSVVGQQITCPWLEPAGPFEVTQGWGPTNVQSEPAEDRSGKHYSHWHAGVDIGCPTNTHLVFPHGLGHALGLGRRRCGDDRERPGFRSAFGPARRPALELQGGR